VHLDDLLPPRCSVWVFFVVLVMVVVARVVVATVTVVARVVERMVAKVVGLGWWATRVVVEAPSV
jgi:hypothetical protein